MTFAEALAPFVSTVDKLPHLNHFTLRHFLWYLSTINTGTCLAWMSFNTAFEKANELDEHRRPQDAVDGQRHDRISLTEQNIGDMSDSTKSSTQDDITVTQRMVSATVGSVLTSLLGK